MNKEQKIIEIISKVLKIEKKKIKKSLQINQVPGWDSLSHINIFLELKKNFKFKTDMGGLAKIKSVNDWINFLLKHDRNSKR
jgi:acyl carrier protein